MASPADRLGAPAHSSNSQVSRKRPASGSWDDSPSAAGNRAAKKRAPRACISCRDRKVRCDVHSGGVPCTNCRLDDVDCILKASNRGKHNPARRQARSRLPSDATAPRASSPPHTVNTDANAATPGSTPGSASATITRSGPGHVVTGQLRERRGSRLRAHSDEVAICDDEEGESQSRHDRQESGHTRITDDGGQFHPSGTVQDARREQQPPPRPDQGSVTGSTPSAQPANPPTSDHLVGLAFEGTIDSPG